MPELENMMFVLKHEVACSSNSSSFLFIL
jgi:hypothetical protein